MRKEIYEAIKYFTVIDDTFVDNDFYSQQKRSKEVITMYRYMYIKDSELEKGSYRYGAKTYWSKWTKIPAYKYASRNRVRIIETLKKRNERDT